MKKQTASSQSACVPAAMLAFLAMLPGAAIAASQATPQNPVTLVSSTDDGKTAQRLLESADAHLAEAAPLSARFEVVTTFNAKYRDTRETGTLKAQTPERLRIEIHRERRIGEDAPWQDTGNGSLSVTDGQTAWNVTLHPQSTQYEQNLPSAVWREQTIGFLAPLRGLTGTGWAAFLPDAHYEGKQTDSGENFDVVSGQNQEGKWTLWLDTAGRLRRTRQEPRKTPGTDLAAVKSRGGFRQRDARLWFTAPTAYTTDTFTYAPSSGAVRVEKPTKRLAPLAVGETAPDFTVQNENEQPVCLSDYKGKVVVVKFWATWCWPCRQSWPETIQTARDFPEAAFLAVALYDSPKSFRKWVSEHRADTPNSLHFAFDAHPQGQDAASTLYGLQATPTLVVIGRDGKIAATFAGYSGPSTRVADAVRTALKAQ